MLRPWFLVYIFRRYLVGDGEVHWGVVALASLILVGMMLIFLSVVLPFLLGLLSAP